MSDVMRWDTVLDAVADDLSNGSAAVIAATIPADLDAERLRTLGALGDGGAGRGPEALTSSGAALQSVVVGRLLREVLGHLTGVKASSLRFETEPHGKPFLAGTKPAPRFNVSHSSSRGLIALSNRFEIGVDVETVADYKERVARRILPPKEFERLDRLSGVERTALFYRLWVAKEACVKATGMGLRTPLRDVAVALGAAEGGWGQVRWKLLDVSDEACACVALESGDTAIEQHLYSVDGIEALGLGQ
jgi:phosphopantetheine--protein transferase-like protein